MPENAEPKVGEVWRRTLRHDSGLIQTDEGPIFAEDGEFVTVGHHRLRWEFASTKVQTTWEKIADAPRAEPSIGSVYELLANTWGHCQSAGHFRAWLGPSDGRPWSEVPEGEIKVLREGWIK